MRLQWLLPCLIATVAGVSACSKPAEPAKQAAAPTTKTALGIHPYGTGDPNFKPDYSKLSPELQKTFTYIDSHIDEHAENIQKWIRQPSISNSGEGIPESAEMVKGFFEKLGCQTARVYDTGTTEYGSQGNPVVYAKCDEGAPKTVAIYWQYDTMPITQPDVWIVPPFEGRVVDGATAVVPAASRVIIGRGATNSKGPEMAVLNAITSMKAANGGKLPVNLIFVAEGDEERMDIGLRKFIIDHSDLFAEADALFTGGPSEGCVYVELTTSGKSWGRGPVQSDVHGVMKRTTDSPAWRHIQMLASLTSKDGNKPLIKGFFDNIEPPTKAEMEAMKAQAARMDLVAMAKASGVARFMSDDPLEVLLDGRFKTSFNLDGLWGGNMYAGGAGAILPNKITSKHNFRYVPRMNGLDIVKKLRAQLDANDYKDVDVKLIGDVPWSRGSSPDTDISHAHQKAAQVMESIGLGGGGGRPGQPALPTSAALTNPNLLYSETAADPAGGYWPSYLFADGEVGQKVGSVSIPMGMGGRGGGGGGRAHAANEFYTIESTGRGGGLANAEKNAAAAFYEYAQITTTPTKPKTQAK
ncbi:MAG TPA: M20/M25/M40 family metallo-hydrolase [Vicinamibacterales bacterium]|nr:M20/M25/M40 family metallo-hydrolase [Vicinamibacterales bacterium]